MKFWCPSLDHFGLRTNFWAGQEVDGANQKFLFEISFPWTFWLYMIQPYLMNIHFCFFLSLGQIFGGGAGKELGKSNFFRTFWNTLSMGFPVVYDRAIFNKHRFLVILGPGTYFCINFLNFLKSHFHGLSNLKWHDHT